MFALNNDSFMNPSFITKTIAGAILFLYVVFAGISPVAAQTISLFAGALEMGGYGGDGGPATAAYLNLPDGVALDAVGNLYIADRNNNVVRKVNTSGVISTFAGTSTAGYSGDGGPATAAELHSPESVAVDASGNVYIADNANNAIRVVNSSGIIRSFAGNGTPSYTGDGGPATAAMLRTPYGLAVGSGNVYFSDNGNNVVRKVNSSGIISTIVGTGALGYSGDGGLATAATLNTPGGLAVDGSGNVYICDAANYVVRKVNSAGIISTFAGDGFGGTFGDGGPATAARLFDPWGIAVDGSGNVFIATGGGNCIRKVNSSGIISTYAGNGVFGYSGDGGPAISAQLYYPNGVAVDLSHNLYIADKGNNRIRIVTPTAPAFSGGSSRSLTTCENSAADSINSLLSITDSGTLLTETYSVTVAPAHGAITVGSTVTSGISVSPTGWAYMPSTGFIGTDAFTIQVNNGTNSASTVINVTVNPIPVAGSITGTDSVCEGYTAELADTTGGGLWSSYNTSVATVGSTGIVTGVAPGVDTIFYSLTNSCGTVRAKQVVNVLSPMECNDEVRPLNIAGGNLIRLFPNPNSGMFVLNLYAQNEEELHIVITDEIGGKVNEFTTITNKDTPVYLNAPAGIYILSALTSKDNYTVKLIIQ